MYELKWFLCGAALTAAIMQGMFVMSGGCEAAGRGSSGSFQSYLKPGSKSGEKIISDIVNALPPKTDEATPSLGKKLKITAETLGSDTAYYR